MIPNPATNHAHFGGSALALGKVSLFGWHPFQGSLVQIYVGALALLANLVVGIVVTLIIRATKAAQGTDSTSPADYYVDENSPEVREVAPVAGA